MNWWIRSTKRFVWPIYKTCMTYYVQHLLILTSPVTGWVLISVFAC